MRLFPFPTGLELAAFAPFLASALTTAPQPAQARTTGTLTYDVATLLYRHPFSALSEWPHVKKPVPLTVATPTFQNDVSTVVGVLYTLSPSFDAKLYVYSTTLTSTSTVSLPTTTITLDRSGHAKTRNSSRSLPSHTTSRATPSRTSTQSAATGTVIFDPPFKIETSTSRANLVILSTVSPSPTKVWIFVTNSATLITETTIQSTVFERETTVSRKTNSSSSTATTKPTHKPTQKPDSCRKKLDQSERAVKGWQGAFAAAASVLGLLLGGLATHLVRRRTYSKRFARFWNKFHQPDDESGAELRSTTPPPRHAWPAPRPGEDPDRKTPAANDGFQRVELGVPPPLDCPPTHAGTRFGRL